MTASCTASPVTSTPSASKSLHTDGPLVGIETERSIICSPAYQAEGLSWGFHYVLNESDKPLTLESLRLNRPNGLLLQGAYVLPMSGDTTMGLTKRFPPAKVAEAYIGTPWSRAVSIEGASLVPGDKYNLVAHIKLTGKAGSVASFDSLTVTYNWGGERYESTSALRTAFARSSRCPR